MVMQIDTGDTRRNKIILEIFEINEPFTAFEIKCDTLKRIRSDLAVIEARGYVVRRGKRPHESSCRPVSVFEMTDKLIEFVKTITAHKTESKEHKTGNPWADIYPELFTLPNLQGKMRTYSMSDFKRV